MRWGPVCLSLLSERMFVLFLEMQSLEMLEKCVKALETNGGEKNLDESPCVFDHVFCSAHKPSVMSCGKVSLELIQPLTESS